MLEPVICPHCGSKTSESGWVLCPYYGAKIGQARAAICQVHCKSCKHGYDSKCSMGYRCRYFDAKRERLEALERAKNAAKKLSADGNQSRADVK